MRVSIFGTGYVGLVTGACLADAGNHVVCVDVDADKIERLKRAARNFTPHQALGFCPWVGLPASCRRRLAAKSATLAAGACGRTALRVQT